MAESEIEIQLHGDWYYLVDLEDGVLSRWPTSEKAQEELDRLTGKGV